MTSYCSQLKISGHNYNWCGHCHNSVRDAVDCIVEQDGDCGSYVVAYGPFAWRPLNTDEEILFDLALERKISSRIDKALRRLEKMVA